LPAVRDCLAGADVVLAVGTELAETDHWCNQLDTSVALLRIDIDRNTLASGHGDQIGLLGDASAMIEAVLNKVGRAPANLAERTEEVATLRARVAPDLQARSSMYAPVLDAIRAALSTDTVVVTDMTELAYAGNDLFWVERPRSWLHPVGFGTLGYALPAAIGAKLGAPTRPVVAMAGDYGFQYTLPELAVAVEHALSLPVLIWNNEGLGVISRKMKQSGIEAVGVAPRNPDFQLLAQAYNCPGHVPASLAAVPKAIAAAFAHPGPSLIELRQSALVGDVG
jgi:5-guanidino-2-oxopentanoate decarboxylase